MKKASPFGLFLYGIWLLCCAFRPADDPGIQVTVVPSASGAITLSITTQQKAYSNIRLEWQLIQNGLPGPKGVLAGLTLSSNHPTLVHLPLKLTGSDEAWLRITIRRPSPAHLTTAVPPTTIILPLRPWHGDQTIPPVGELTFTDSNNVFTVAAPNTLIEFDKQTGLLQHYEAGHILLMADTGGMTPALWSRIAPHLQLFSTSTGSQLVIVKAEYTIPETGSLLHISYTINAAGDMLVGESLETDTTQHLPDSVSIPPLPQFGWRWLLPPGLDTITALSSADSTTPPAIVHHPLDTPVTDLRETRYLSITGDAATGLHITADSALLQPVFATDSIHTTRTILYLHAPDFSPSAAAHQLFFRISLALPPPPPVLRKPAPPASPRRSTPAAGSRVH